MYVHIRYGVFVALDILEVFILGFFGKISLLLECFRVGKFRGFFAGVKYLCGALRLPDLEVKSSVFGVGGLNE